MIVLSSLLLWLSFRYPIAGNPWIGVSLVLSFVLHQYIWCVRKEHYDMVSLDKYEWPSQHFALRRMDHVLKDDTLPVVDTHDKFSSEYASLWMRCFSYIIRLYEKEVLVLMSSHNLDTAIWELPDSDSLGRYDGAEEARRFIKQEGYHGYVHYLLNKQIPDPKGIEKLVVGLHRAGFCPIHWTAMMFEAHFGMWHEVGFFVGAGAITNLALQMKPCKLRSVMLWHFYEEKEHGLAELALLRTLKTLPWYTKLFTFLVKLPLGSIMDAYYYLLTDLVFCLVALIHEPRFLLRSLLVVPISFYYTEKMRLLTWSYILHWRVPSSARVLRKMAEQPWVKDPHFAEAEAAMTAALRSTSAHKCGQRPQAAEGPERSKVQDSDLAAVESAVTASS